LDVSSSIGILFPVLLLGVGCKSIDWHSVSYFCGSLMRLAYCLYLVLPYSKGWDLLGSSI
jgi:hypothetical protein